MAYFPFEARLVAATNRDLAAEVKRGRFREDLFHRLNVVVLTMPPLRERRTDIPSLVEFFLTKHTPPGAIPKNIGTKTLKILQTYPWPGNIRELENAIERAVNLAEGEELAPEDIIPSSGGKFEEPPSEFDSPSSFSLMELEKSAIHRALVASNGNRRLAAELVGVGEATLYRKLKEYGIS